MFQNGVNQHFRIASILVCMLPALHCYGQSTARSESPIVQDLSVEPIVSGEHVSSLQIRDENSGRVLRSGELFALSFADGTHIESSKLAAVRVPTAEQVSDPHQLVRTVAPGAADQERCWSFTVPEKALTARWCLVARSETHYVRELLQLQANDRDVPLSEVRLIDITDPGATVDGSVKGSPIVDRTMFFGVEHPLSTSTVQDGRARASLIRTLPLRAGQSITYSAVIGTAPVGQLRRRFLEYLENERPRPYQAFLHYNSWYDLGYRNRFDEAGVLDRIRAFGDELTKQRKVKLDSFLLDDGWDDTRNLWNFNAGFPNGLRAASQAAASYGFGIGLWLSPWGGYGDEKLQRVAYGREHGYEILNDGYALSGPKYYQRFEQTCQEMITKYNVNQFKFDGTGNADRVFPGSAFDSDFDAAIHLIEDLRRQKPDLFINLTTGTTASPFWLFFADSIWRGGEDHDFAGVGTSRQRWITYRDEQTYKNIVLKGPLFPLNSLMLHGIVYAKQAEGLSTDPANDLADEVHSFFGSGTQTQELYITPSLMSSANWDTLAAAARWSRAQRDVLRDAHWLGGDPAKLEVYGWAAWAPQLGIITLRNPSDQPQAFRLELGTAFELESKAARRFRLRSVWAPVEKSLSDSTLTVGHPATVRLGPFQVLTLEATPVN